MKRPVSICPVITLEVDVSLVERVRLENHPHVGELGVLLDEVPEDHVCLAPRQLHAVDVCRRLEHIGQGARLVQRRPQLRFCGDAEVLRR